MDAPKKETPLALIGVLLGLFGSGVGIWTQLDKRVQDKQLEAIKLEISQRQDARSETGAERDYLLRVTDKVIAAMEPPRSAERQQVASLLIDTLKDTTSQQRLRSALLSAAAPEVKVRLEQTIAREAQYEAVQVADQVAQAKGQPVAATRLPGINRQSSNAGGKVAVDIFWCEGTGGVAHKAEADRLFNAAQASGQFGRVRVRPLPESVNRRPGYGLVSNIIRHQDVEQSAAGQLQKLAPNFTPQQISYDTKDYISAFVCASAD